MQLTAETQLIKEVDAGISKARSLLLQVKVIRALNMPASMATGIVGTLYFFHDAPLWTFFVALLMAACVGVGLWYSFRLEKRARKIYDDIRPKMDLLVEYDE